MTNIAFQDIVGGTVNVYTANKHLPKWERIDKALKELEHTGNIIVYLYKGRKLRRIKVKRY
jgi:hypothetical protein